MKISYDLNFPIFSFGQCLALGISWHLDSGLDVLFDTLLGWIYIAFKMAQYIWP